MNDDVYDDDYLENMLLANKDFTDKIAEAVKKVNSDSTRSKKYKRAAEKAMLGGNNELDDFKILVRMFLKDPTDEDLYNELIKELDPDKKQKTPADVIIDALNGYASDKPMDAFFYDVYAFHGLDPKTGEKK